MTNATAEIINGLYEAEAIHRSRPRRSFEAVEFATFKRVDWFKHRRSLEPIGNVPPAEAEEKYYVMLDQILMTASLKSIWPPTIALRFNIAVVTIQNWCLHKSCSQHA